MAATGQCNPWKAESSISSYNKQTNGADEIQKKIDDIYRQQCLLKYMNVWSQFTMWECF